MPNVGSSHVTKVKDFWYYSRRVPLHLQGAVGRKMHLVSTKVPVTGDKHERDKHQAMEVAKIINAQVEASWHAAVNGSPIANDNLLAAIHIAQQGNLAPATMAQVIEMPLDQRVERIRALAKHSELNRPVVQHAFLGVPANTNDVDTAGGYMTGITIAGLVGAYKPYCATENRGMNKIQKGKWERALTRAVANLLRALAGVPAKTKLKPHMIAAVDKDIGRLSATDAETFKKWWDNRLQTEVRSGKPLTQGTANKDFFKINAMMQKLREENSACSELGKDHLYQEKIKLFKTFKVRNAVSKARKNRYPAFKATWLQTVLLAPGGALSVLDKQHRCLVALMLETGARPSELVNLTKKTVHLNAPIPYIEITNDGREVKNDYSDREVPLVGIALEAAKLVVAEAKGDALFSELRETDDIGADIRGAWRDNGMLPTERHSLYSLRHDFEDRHALARTYPKLVKFLMGHTRGGLYGTDDDTEMYSLTEKREALEKIAFKDYPADILA